MHLSDVDDLEIFTTAWYCKQRQTDRIFHKLAGFYNN